MYDEFGLSEFSDSFITKIIDYRMYKDKKLNRYLTYEEIAQRENCSPDDIRKILISTAIIWNH